MTNIQYQWRLGDSSKWYETNNHGAGSISSGQGDHGGISYGEYQFSSHEGSVQEYLNQSPYKQYFEGLRPATKEFNEEWRHLANTDPSFEENQYNFIKNKYYDVQSERLKQEGIDLSTHGPAVQDLLWSTSVQFRNGTLGIFEEGIKEKFGVKYDLSKLSDKDIIDAVQDYKIKNNDLLFKSSSEKVRASTLNRAYAEKKDLEQFAETGRPVEHLHAHNAEATLHQGSRGPAVAELQTQLTQLGYTDNRGRPLHPDAHFGPATRNALEAFQHDHGLKPDGVAGRATLDKLDALAPHPDHAMHVPVGTRVGQMLAAAETGDWQRLRADTQEMLAQARAEVNGLGHPQQHGQSPAAQHGGQAAQTPAQADTRPFDPRHPQHPEHAMYCSVRDQLVALNKTEGITLTSGQLDNCTAALMADARAAGMRTIDAVQFSVHLDSNRTTDISQVVSFQGDPKDLAGRATATNMIQALDTPAAQSFQQFDQNTQVMAQQDQQLQQQRLAEQQSQGMSMHR